MRTSTTIMKPFLCILMLLAGKGGLYAQSSGGVYSISTASLDAAGGRVNAAAIYRNDSTLTATAAQTADSSIYQAASGFPATLRDAIALIALPRELPESAATQLSLRQQLDDGTQLDISSTGASWTVLNGPCAVNASGLVTTQSVFSNTQASLQITLGSLTSPNTLTILNTLTDNFGTYAADGISDDWQVQYFGQNNPLAAPAQDPDGDGQNNLFEFTAGLLPNSSVSRFTLLLESVPGQTGQKRMICQPATSGRSFTLLKSTTLLPGSWQAVPGASGVGNNGTLTLTDPAASNARAFYRVQITR